MAEFDIAVAGGGPAGLQFARTVATRSDRSVVVLEANDSLTDNDKSTGGTFDETVDRFDIPDDVVMDTTDAVVFEAGGSTGRIPVPGYVLDFPALLAFLGDEAASGGAEIRTGARVTAPLTDGGRVTGVEYRDGGRERVTADVVVDATGPAAVLVEELGLFDPGSATRAVGKEFEVVGAHGVEDMLFRFDHDLAPGGYAWAFPAGDDVLKAGVCWLDDHFAVHAADPGRTIDGYIDEWLADDRWAVETRREAHAGSAYIDDSLTRRAADGLVAVGDTVASINPLLGEGIRPGMKSAEMAADAVLDALDAGDTSRDRLATYERRWQSDRGGHWRRQNLVSHLLYGFDADQQRRFVEKADRLSPAQVDRFRRYELTVRDYLSVYPFAVRDLRRLPTVLRHA